MYEAEYRSKLMTPVAAVKNFGKGPESWDISEQLVVLEKWKIVLAVFPLESVSTGNAPVGHSQVVRVRMIPSFLRHALCVRKAIENQLIQGETPWM